MSKGMESNLWKQMKRNLPSNMIATRIENRNGGGIPDVHFLWGGAHPDQQLAKDFLPGLEKDRRPGPHD